MAANEREFGVSKWWGGGLDLNMLLLQEQGSIVGFAWVDSHLDLWLIVCNGSAFL